MNRICPGIIVKDAAATRDFYARHLAATVIFDSGWYVSVRLGGKAGPEVSFATPHFDADVPVTPGCLSLYVEVEDVDQSYRDVRASGAPVNGPPQDNPWGDRSFTLLDPNGVRVTLFSPRPVSAEYAAAVKV